MIKIDVSKEISSAFLKDPANFTTIIDKKGIIQYTNRTVKGISAKAMAGKNIFDFIDKEQQQQVKKTIEGVLKTGDSGNYKCSIQISRKKSSLFDTTVSAIKHSGQIVAAILISSEIADRNKQESSNEQLIHDMEERIKELECTYGVTNSIREAVTLDELFKKLVKVIPTGWRYPEITRARIKFNGDEYITKKFTKTKWKQSSDIIVNGKNRGLLEAYYTEQRPEIDEGPFSNEERRLIENISHLIGETIEHKLDQEAKIEEQGRFKAFADSAPDMFTIWDSKLNLIECNENAVAFIAKATKNRNIIGLNVLDISPGLKKTGRYNEYLKVIKTGKIFSATDIIPDAKFGNSHLSVTAFKIGDGLGIIIKDITKLNKIENLLKESEKKYREFIEGTDDIVTEVDGNGRFTYVNKSVEKIFGLKAEDCIGRLAFDSVHPDDRTATQKQFEGWLKKKEKNAKFTNRQISVDGKVSELLWTINIYYNDDGSVRTVKSIARDITELKILERDRGRLVAILEGTNDFVSLATPDKKITYVNRAGLKIVGLHENENLTGKKIRNMHPEWATRIIEDVGIPAAIKNGIWQGETALLGKDGHEIPVSQIIMAHKDSSGELEYISTIIRDISDIKQAQEELQKAKDKLIEQQSQAILELSTPIIQIWEGILTLPLIGTIDTARARQIIENLLESIIRTQASVAIMDITGVPVIDTQVANHMLKTVKAAKMLGTDVILSGVSPHNAQTLVKLGVELGSIITKGSLQDGLKLAFEMTNNKVTNGIGR